MVSVCSRCCVTIFSSRGERLRSLNFGKSGYGQGQFISPCGVTVDGEGNILVAESPHSKVNNRRTIPHIGWY